MAEAVGVREKGQGLSFSTTDLWVLFLVTVWGVNFVAIKGAVGEMSALAFNALRFGLGTLLMIALWRAFERGARIERRDWLGLALLGIVGNTIYQLTFIVAIKLSTASNTSLIVATSPIWTAILAALLSPRPPLVAVVGWDPAVVWRAVFRDHGWR